MLFCALNFIDLRGYTLCHVYCAVTLLSQVMRKDFLHPLKTPTCWTLQKYVYYCPKLGLVVYMSHHSIRLLEEFCCPPSLLVWCFFKHCGTSIYIYFVLKLFNQICSVSWPKYVPFQPTTISFIWYRKTSRSNNYHVFFIIIRFITVWYDLWLSNLTFTFRASILLELSMCVKSIIIL